MVSCDECGIPYPEMGLDITLPDEQWAMINPEIKGILCGNCMAKRAATLPGAYAIRARIVFVDELDEDIDT